MNISTSSNRPQIIPPPVLQAHVPEPPEHDPSVPPDMPPPGEPDREVDLPPREEPDEVGDPQRPPREEPPMRVAPGKRLH
jgi:hypothetical protein